MLTRDEFLRRYPNFKPEEMACKCGQCGPESGLLVEPDSMDKLQAMRTGLGVPFYIISGYRCSNHPEERSKANSTSGAHPNGQGFDVRAAGAFALTIVEQARDYGFTGVGVNQKGKSRSVHLDDLPGSKAQPRPWLWSY